jgi:hypothetical protein
LRLFLIFILGWRRGLTVTRFSAAAVISICWLVFNPAPAHAGPDIDPRQADDSVVCDGGTLSNGACSCPAGFDLMSTNGNLPGSGTCVRTNAENCLGGELTVAGKCLCNRRVIMSGETYGLEFVGGKCIPKRCPENTYSKNGKCAAVSDRGDAPEDKSKPDQATGPSDEPARHHGCGRGMVRTHAGCVVARRRYPGVFAAPEQYYLGPRSYRLRGYPVAQPSW